MADKDDRDTSLSGGKSYAGGGGTSSGSWSGANKSSSTSKSSSKSSSYAGGGGTSSGSWSGANKSASKSTPSKSGGSGYGYAGGGGTSSGSYSAAKSAAAKSAPSKSYAGSGGTGSPSYSAAKAAAAKSAPRSTSVQAARADTPSSARPSAARFGEKYGIDVTKTSSTVPSINRLGAPATVEGASTFTPRSTLTAKETLAKAATLTPRSTVPATERFSPATATSTVSPNLVDSLTMAPAGGVNVPDLALGNIHSVHALPMGPATTTARTRGLGTPVAEGTAVAAGTPTAGYDVPAQVTRGLSTLATGPAHSALTAPAATAPAAYNDAAIKAETARIGAPGATIDKMLAGMDKLATTPAETVATPSKPGVPSYGQTMEEAAATIAANAPAANAPAPATVPAQTAAVTEDEQYESLPAEEAPEEVATTVPAQQPPARPAVQRVSAVETVKPTPKPAVTKPADYKRTMADWFKSIGIDLAASLHPVGWVAQGASMLLTGDSLGGTIVDAAAGKYGPNQYKGSEHMRNVGGVNDRTAGTARGTSGGYGTTVPPKEETATFEEKYIAFVDPTWRPTPEQKWSVNPTHPEYIYNASA